jgi:hypothetical protein
MTENTENTTEKTENRENIKILSHLQNKNIQLINTVMDKSKEIFMLQGELEKHRNEELKIKNQKSYFYYFL